MYNPMSLCSTILHILMRAPILVVALGLLAAVGFVKNQINANPGATPEQVIARQEFKDVVDTLNKSGYAKLAEQSVPAFEAIVKTESGLVIDWPFYDLDFEGRKVIIGVHRDGVSYGPAGLTEIATRDIFRRLPDCRSLGYDEVLSDPQQNINFAYIYLLDQLHRFKSLDRAIVAYNYGPTRTMEMIKAKKPLPRDYLKKVKEEMKK